MKSNEDYLKQYSELEESVKGRHNFYLILFVYVVMTGYLHYIDLKDGSYDWAFYSWILMTFSMIWMAVIAFSFPLKSKMIFREMKKRQLNSTSKQQNHGNQ